MTLPEPELLKAFAGIRVWQRGGRRAVHKPLLVLLVLGRLWRGEPAIVSFAHVEPALRKLFEQFGPASAMASVHYPFWHLQTDGLWELTGPASILNRSPGATPTLTEMRAEVSGGFTPAVSEMLSHDIRVIPRLARRIVEAHFPESLQQDVLESVGLPLDEGEPSDGDQDKRKRDASFRPRVLMAYEYRCCICGHDLRLAGQVVGLDAAHIQWFQAGGPDVESNGLALCSLHHKLFDLGVFTVLPQGYTLVVSQHVTGGDQAKERMLTYHGAGLILPQSKSYLPGTDYLAWHKTEVFKAPQRE